MSRWLINCICPRCGHCATVGLKCLNCEMRGREIVFMVPRTIRHANEGVPEPLFFLTPSGTVIPN